MIIQSGIGEIVYLSDKYRQTDSVKASKVMLEKSGVLYRQFTTEREAVLLAFREEG